MDIKDIDFSRKYTGYLWLSNAAKPIALTEPGIVDKSLFEKKNPFVAEAQLYDSEGDVSVSIRYADGRYYAAIHKAASITGDSADEVVYPGVRMGEGSPLGLRFRRVWGLRKDDACLGMEAPFVESEAFIGFPPSSGGDAG